MTRTILLIVAAAAAAMAFAATAATDSRPASRPAATSKATATAPATARATQAAYPPPELVAATKAAAEVLRKRLDGSFEIVVAPPFVVAGNMKRDELNQHIRGSIERPAAALWASYFKARPDQVITVLLMVDDKSYRAWAKRLFDDDDVSHYGYYRPSDRTLVMNISTGGGTLIHELTHSLIVYDFPDVPTWFNEALGSLHEQCTIEPGRIVGLENWRLPDLQVAIREGKLRPLRDMLTADDFYTNHRGLNYAQARYLAMYLQRKGKLAEFYTYYRAHHDKTEDAIAALEHVLGSSLDKIETDLNKWVLTLRFPPR
jgi:hypothetical protein